MTQTHKCQIFIESLQFIATVHTVCLYEKRCEWTTIISIYLILLICQFVSWLPFKNKIQNVGWKTVHWTVFSFHNATTITASYEAAKRWIKQQSENVMNKSSTVSSTTITWTTEVSHTSIHQSFANAHAPADRLPWVLGRVHSVQWWMVTPLKEPPENCDRKILMLLEAKRSDCFHSGYFNVTQKSVKSFNGASHLKSKYARARALNNISTFPVWCDCTASSIRGERGDYPDNPISLYGLSLCFYLYLDTRMLVSWFTSHPVSLSLWAVSQNLLRCLYTPCWWDPNMLSM